MRVKNRNGFTIIELLAVVLILGIISLITLAVLTNIDRAKRASYYDTLEKNVTLAAREYFFDNINERPVDTDFASLIEINNRHTEKNLETKAYISRVLDMKNNTCPGKVISYLDIDGEITYVPCLECEDYQSSNRLCGCEVITTYDEATDTEYYSCQLDEIPAATLTTVYKDNPGQVYKSYGAEGEEFTYDDALWTKESIRITYTTTYQYAKKIRVVDENGMFIESMSCDLTGTSTKTCSKDITTTTYGTFKAYVVDDLNRLSSTGEKEFYIKIDKTTPTVSITATDTAGQTYTSGTSSKNINLTLNVDPNIAPSGYTYKWYYSTDITNGTNRVLITEMSVIPIGENIVEVIDDDPESGGEEEDETSDGDEIVDVDTSQGIIGYTFSKEDQSLFVNVPRLLNISRKYIVEITTGTGTVVTASKNVTFYRPQAKVSITAKKSSSGSKLQSGAWSNENVVLTANITEPANYSVIRWTKTNLATGTKVNIQNTSPTLSVSSISTKSGDAYTAVVALSDNTDQEESEAFTVKIDKDAPKCGSVSGGSKSWTKSSRTISVKCSDSTSGCSSSSFSKSFSSTTKTSSITIKDKAGNTKSCSVNVYVDKTAPSVSISMSNCTTAACTYSVSASDSHSGVSYKKYSRGAGYFTYSKSFLANPTKEQVCAYAVDKVGNKSSTKCN